VTLAILGEHLIRYTREDVLPRLSRRLDDIRSETQALALEARARRRTEPALDATLDG
jgi:hypothetical protein